VREAFDCTLNATKTMLRFDCEAGDRFIENTSNLVLDYDFAGIGFAKIGLAASVAAWAKLGFTLKDPFVVSRECERSTSCQHVLGKQPDMIRAKHLIGDIVGTLDERIATHLKLIEQEHLQTSKPSKAHAAFDFNEISINHIDKRGEKRKATPGSKPEFTAAKKARRKEGAIDGSDMLKLMMGALTETDTPFKRTTACDACGKECNTLTKCDQAGADSKLMNFSGTPCTPWTNLGSQRQLLHEVTMPFAIWLRQLQVTQPEWCFHECTPHFRVCILEEYLGHEYNFWTILIGPQLFGLPMSRERRITFFAKKIYNLKHSMERLAIFAKSICMTGDGYMVAPSEDQEAWREELVRLRCRGPEASWLEAMTPGQIKRLLNVRDHPKYKKLSVKAMGHILINPEQNASRDQSWSP